MRDFEHTPVPAEHAPPKDQIQDPGNGELVVWEVDKTKTGAWIKASEDSLMENVDVTQNTMIEFPIQFDNVDVTMSEMQSGEWEILLEFDDGKELVLYKQQPDAIVDQLYESFPEVRQ